MGKYIGRDTPYGLYEKQTLSPNSVDVVFDLTYKIGSNNSILVVYDGGILEPTADFFMIAGGTKISFSFVPQLGISLFLIYLGRELATPLPRLPRESYTPTIETFNGMLNSTTVHEAEWSFLNNTNILVSIRFTTILSDTQDNKIRFSLPMSSNGGLNIVGSTNLETVTELEPGMLKLGDDDHIDIYRVGKIDYSLDEWVCSLKVEYEAE